MFGAAVIEPFLARPKDTAIEAGQVVRVSASEAEDYVGKSIKQRPYTTAAVALGVGFLIGRLTRRDY
jgi:ElaB/YqjD/DUF883 family membrane-anchored ribosome-binding protein